MRYTNIILFCLMYFPTPLVSQDIKTDGFRIGLVADIQYSDQETAGSRFYRNSLEKVSTMLKTFNSEDLLFIVDLGDRIDRDYKSFEAIDRIISTSTHPVIFVPGNHDYVVADSMKPEIRKKTGHPRAYYSNTIRNWHFVFLNGLENSLEAYTENSPKYKKALKELDRIKESGTNNAYDWNGGLGSKQTRWLKKEMKKAKSKGLNLIVFCHQPIFPDNAHSLWNYQRITTLLADFPNEVWWISGHDHKGGFEKHHGINMLTLHGMVEGVNPSYGILEINGDHVRLIGYGDQEDL